jgi:putative colanic acid biosysnthesis UDP-glucose lipid carrier transferase
MTSKGWDMRWVDRTSAGGIGSAAGLSSFIDLRHPAVLNSSSAALERRACRVTRSRAKRGLDIVGAAFAIVSLLPIFVLIALAVALDSPGPILFRQERYGERRRVFLLCKFRTMTVLEASGTFVQARARDSRFTRVGTFLRRTSLDELPQLLNVLRGEMSLVGPRPHAVAMDDSYAQFLPHYGDRHLVRPGMTGLAQVAGHRGPTYRLAAIAQRLRHDRVYIRRWSFWLDIKILAKTPWCLLHPNAL